MRRLHFKLFLLIRNAVVFHSGLFLAHLNASESLGSSGILGKIWLPWLCLTIQNQTCLISATVAFIINSHAKNNNDQSILPEDTAYQ